MTRSGSGPIARSVRLAAACALFLLGASASRAGGPDVHQGPAGSGVAPARLSSQGVNITYRIYQRNNVGMTLFNDGFFGNNFASRTEPSLEYPLASNVEHMPRGGLWVGAKRFDAAGDSAYLVSTATRSARIGSRAFDSEFTPITGITERSILPDDRYFSRQARSDQDFLYSFADTVPITSPDEDHRPLDIQVDVETLLFSSDPFDDMIIVNFKIINLHPTDPLFDVCAGFYTEFASGYKDPADPNWSRSWFDQKDIGYVDSLRLVTEHHYTLDNGDAPSWIGLKLLGSKPVGLDSANVSFNWWNWLDEINRQGDAPSDDDARYAVMANGQIDATGGSEAPNNDPVELLSVGPFPILLAGDTLSVSYAILGGEEDPRSGRSAEEDLAFNAAWAQTAYDLNFNIPVPPPSPRLKVVPGHESITLLWKDDPERFIDPKSHEQDFEGYRVYIGEGPLRTDQRRILEADLPDSVFYNTGLDAIRRTTVVAADTFQYRYEIDGLKDGFKYWVGVTSFDSGTPEVESLESGINQNRTFVIPGSPARSSSRSGKVKVFPNPYRGDAAWDGSLGRDRYIWFANLPARCTIRIYTLAGDLVDTIHFDQDEYHATEIRGIYDPTDTRNPESDIPALSGGMAAWNLISKKDQGVATGLYMYSVENADTGERELGTFLILK